jgi:hypothetical protein
MTGWLLSSVAGPDLASSGVADRILYRNSRSSWVVSATTYSSTWFSQLDNCSRQVSGLLGEVYSSYAGMISDSLTLVAA